MNWEKETWFNSLIAIKTVTDYVLPQWTSTATIG